MNSSRLYKATRTLAVVSLVVVLSACTSISSMPTSSPTVSSSPTPTPTESYSDAPLFVALGDFGTGDKNQRSVADAISQINPEWFVSLADNVYSQEGYEALVGDYFGDFVSRSRFLSATGNHDYTEGIANFDSYFGTSEKTRYYKSSITEDIDVFVLDSQAALDSAESMETQKDWLIGQISESNATFKLVVLHHPPFSSGTRHGPTTAFQWDFSSMGVNAVLSGHEHLYERISIDNVTYLVSGAGGRALHSCGTLIDSQAICIDETFGALYFTLSGNSLLGEFRSSKGEVLDSFTIF